MCECCTAPLWLLAKLWRRLWNELTGRNIEDHGYASDRYKRVSQFDEEAQLGEDRNSSLKTELISTKQQLNEAEQQLSKTEQEVIAAERDKQFALNKMSELEQKLRASEKAKDEALSRLSEHVALKLADNNPNIADLSYNAFDALSGQPGFEQESKAIQFLLEVVQDCFKVCREESYNQLQHLLTAYHTTVEAAPQELVKMTKDTRKKYASVSLPTLQQTVFNSLNARYGNLMQDEAVQAYVNRCTELCWLMSVQDPPMALYSDVGLDKKYDKTKYREYMKSGDYVDYIVWPCVLIQNGGNLMSKGVAQGSDQPNTETLVTIE